MKKFFTDITLKKKKHYRITEPGVHVFFLYNTSADLSFTIAHEKAHLQVFGLYEGFNTEKFTLTTRQKHIVPGAKSFISVRGIFYGKSRFSYDGLIHILKKATRTDAALESRNLLMSEHSYVSARPQLEILPADVRCTHAATISHIKQHHVEFLKSRGLSQSQAKDLLVAGFRKKLFLDMAHVLTGSQAQKLEESYTK